MSDATTAIRALVDEAEAHQLDPDPFLALHTDDAIVVNFGGRRVLGRAALEDAMRGALASPLAKVLTTFDVHDIRFVRPDVAIVSATKHVSDERGTDDTFASQGSTSFVVVDDGGTWRIALAQTTPIAGS
jgi:uncharacterized protein (TIGR02246 family)